MSSQSSNLEVAGNGQVGLDPFGPHIPAKLIHLLIELEMLEIIQLTG